jgi:hypothetical protein
VATRGIAPPGAPMQVSAVAPRARPRGPGDLRPRAGGEGPAATGKPRHDRGRPRHASAAPVKAARPGPAFENGRRVTPKWRRGRPFDVGPCQTDIPQHPLVETLQKRHLAVMPPGVGPRLDQGGEPSCGTTAYPARRAERAGNGWIGQKRDRSSHELLRSASINVRRHHEGRALISETNVFNLRYHTG